MAFRKALPTCTAVLGLAIMSTHTSAQGSAGTARVQPGVVGLTPGRHLLVLGWILAFDTSLHH